MPLLSLKNIFKNYGAIAAADKLSLSVERGEIFGLLGPSGCGKTTALRMVLGLEAPDVGVIEFEGRDITRTPSETRGFGMVFQNYALFTNLDVSENVAFGMKPRRKDETDVAERVEEMLALVRLPGYGQRRINELSAGQQQRVAIARAIAMEPPLLLFDEPLANLDIGLRRETGWELRELITRLNLTAIYVTHDQAESFTLCDRIGVMSEGRILQTGAPSEIYDRPDGPAVARFLGMNLIRAICLSSVHDTVAEFKTLDGDHILRAFVPLEKEYSRKQPCLLAVRPEDVSVKAVASASGNALWATVREVLFGGVTTRLKLDVGGLGIEALTLRANGITPGANCLVEILPERITVLPDDAR
jgi:ABC-type Fe3+/spermidine/putrescine transport system ATPase subunit